MPDSLTVTKKVHFTRAKKGKRQIKYGPQPERRVPSGRIPRVARLMALAIKFDSLLTTGAVRDQAELAELGHVSRPRVTQIMNFLHLAPDIQEEILHMPRTQRGRDPISEREMRPVIAVVNWDRQRELWKAMRSCSSRSARVGEYRPRNRILTIKCSNAK